jgi:hypothetical protein
MAITLRERTGQRAAPSHAPNERRSTTGPLLWAAAAVVVLGVLGVVLGVGLRSTGDDGATSAAVGPPSTGERICQLATQGSIPLEACPAASPVLQPRPPLYTPTELETIRLVNAGQLPGATLDGSTFLIKRLANEGQIPREAAYGSTTR